MTEVFYVVLLFGIIVAVAVAIVFLFISFVRYPLQNSIRALLALLAALIANTGIPSIKGDVSATVDWGWFLKLDAEALSVVNGDPSFDFAVAFISVSILLSICFVRVPDKPT